MSNYDTEGGHIYHREKYLGTNWPSNYKNEPHYPIKYDLESYGYGDHVTMPETIDAVGFGSPEVIGTIGYGHPVQASYIWKDREKRK